MHGFARVDGESTTHLEHNTDIFYFLCFSSFSVNIQQHQGESPHDKHMSRVRMDEIV